MSTFEIIALVIISITCVTYVCFIIDALWTQRIERKYIKRVTEEVHAHRRGIEEELKKAGEEKLDCGHEKSEHSPYTTGYGITPDGKKHCYDCCAETERQYMRDNNKTTLYLVQRDGKYNVTDWSGRFSIPVRVSKSKHNWAGTRYDVWFSFEGAQWHGVRYGERTELCHCKRVGLGKEEKCQKSDT